MQNNQIKQISNPVKTVIALPVQKYKVLNKNKSKNVVTNVTNEYKEIFTALLKIQDETYSISEIEKVNKFLSQSNSSIEDLKTKFVNMNKAKEIEKLLTNKYPQLNGYITEIQIKYTRDKNNNLNAAHKITIEFNGKSNQLSFSYLTGKLAQKKYKGSDIEEFVKNVKEENDFSELDRLEAEIPSLKGHIKLGERITNYDFYVYIYKNISNQDEIPIKRNYSTLLKKKEDYKNLSFEGIYILLEDANNRTVKTEDEYLNEYVLNLLPDTEKERISSFEVAGNKNKEIRIKLKDKDVILIAKLNKLYKRKSEQKRYNSIEDLFKSKANGRNSKTDEEYLNEYVLNLVPNSERERISSYKITGESGYKEVEIQLKGLENPVKIKISLLGERKRKNKEYNSIEELFTINENNKPLTEKEIKEKLGNKAKYFHSFEKERNEEKQEYKYFVIFNINGCITPKWAFTTVKNYLSLNDTEFEDKVKNGPKSKTKTDKEVEDDLKSNPKYIETINRYNNSHSTKLIFETTKLIERTKSTSTQKFSIRDSFNKEWEFSRGGLNFENHTIRFSSSQNFSCADNRNVSQGEAIVEDTITRLSRNIPFGVRSQDNSLLENHIFDYVFNAVGNPYAILEIDGAQHYDEESETFTRTSLEEQKNKDKEKNVFANQNNLKMARIRYDKLDRKIEQLLFEVTIYITFLNFSNIQHEGLNKINQKRFQEEVNFHLKNSLQDILTELELENTDENIKQLYEDLEWMLESHNESENIPEDIFNELPILNLIKEKFNIKYF